MAINLVAQGSSTTAGATATSSFIELWDIANPSETFTSFASGGEVYTNFIADEASVNALRVPGSINIYWFQPGSNDFPSTDFSWLRPHLSTMRLAGWIIVLVNQLPRPFENFNEWRNNDLNPELAACVSEGYADYLMDWASDPVIGIDSAGYDTDVISDGTHPAQATHDIGYEDYVLPIMDQIVRPRYVLSW